MGLVLDTSALIELERLVGHSAGRELPWDEELNRVGGRHWWASVWPTARYEPRSAGGVWKDFASK